VGQGAPGAEPAALARALGRPGGVATRTRAGVLAGLREDPERRGLARVLGGAALVAVALSVLGLGLAVRRVVRDGAAELADLEADGTPPSALRRVVVLQGAAMAALGLTGAAAAAAVLTALAPAVVRAGTGGAAPVPPLDGALPAAGIAAVAAAALLAAALLVGALARRSFRAPWPGRPPAGEGA
jgi:hypothetical protein